MKKINIAFLYSSKGFGGIVRNLSLIVNNLDKEKFDVTVISLVNEGDRDSALIITNDSGITLFKVDDARKFDVKAIKRIDSIIRDKGVDILSCHGYKADIYGLILRRSYGLKVKLVTMAHGWVTPGLKFSVYYTLDKIAMRFFDKIILVSAGLKKELFGFMIPAQRIVVVNNAIDPETLKVNEDRKAIRSRFGLNDSDKVVGFVGRLSREKDIGTTIMAVKCAVSGNVNIKFLIAGDGPQKDELVKLSRKLGIENRIIFIGYQKNTAPVYRAIDIYASAARKEGLPNSLLEAQAAGVPCIATDIGGNTDIIKDGINGFLFDPGDHKALSQDILILLNDKELRETFIRESRTIIMNSFSMTQRMRKLEDLYMNLYKYQD